VPRWNATGPGLTTPAPGAAEILTRDPDRLAITFTAVEDDFPGPAGTLVVRESAEG
jgi:hypothetical protein